MSFGTGYQVAGVAPERDRGVALGVFIAVALVGAGVAFGGNALNFINLPSFLIVLGGTLGATLANFSLSDLRHAWNAFQGVLFTRIYRPLERIEYLVSLSQVAKKEGLLVLEEESRRVDDPFLKLALDITVDGQKAADVKRILETETHNSFDRSMRAVQVFETMGNYAPAMGLIGTLIGLIQMLSSLQDVARVGPAMALALVTTFYGAMLANIIFLPVAGKIRNRSEETAVVKALTMEGVLSIAQQESHLVLEQRLQSFLPMIQGR